jgi:hypothetical protein
MIEPNALYEMSGSPRPEPGQDQQDWLRAEQRHQNWLRLEQDEQDYLRAKQEIALQQQ